MTECYLIVLEESGKGFTASVAELPGCEVVAETREEALRLIREAIELRATNEKGVPRSYTHPKEGARVGAATNAAGLSAAGKGAW